LTQQANTYEELSCVELVELVTDYLEGALPDELHQRFEAHIAHCSGCQTYLEQMRATILATGTLAPDSLSPEAESALLDAFRGWRSELPRDRD
jgi:anti-sigma factor RsiW